MKTSSILLEENILSTYLNESNSLSKLTRFLKQKEEINKNIKFQSLLFI